MTWYADPAGADERCELRCAGFTVRAGDNALRPGIAAVTARLEDGTLRVLAGPLPEPAGGGRAVPLRRRAAASRARGAGGRAQPRPGRPALPDQPPGRPPHGPPPRRAPAEAAADVPWPNDRCALADASGRRRLTPGTAASVHLWRTGHVGTRSATASRATAASAPATWCRTSGTSACTPSEQQGALPALYREVGFARSLLAYELPDGRLKLIDGHLRRDLDPDMEVDVEVLDVNDDEARALLLSIDPLAALAETQEQLHHRLLELTPAPRPELQAAWQAAAARAGRRRADRPDRRG